jgi:hypothetical protein
MKITKGVGIRFQRNNIAAEWEKTAMPSGKRAEWEKGTFCLPEEEKRHEYHRR